MADISKIKTIDGTTYDIKDTAGRKEANLEWGGKNFTASYGPIDAAMIGALGANRLELAKAAGIVVEYSRDNGATWTDYEMADNDKRKILSSIGGAAALGKYTSADFGNVTTNWKLRITLVFPAAGTYTVLNKFAIYMSSAGAQGPYVTIDGCRKSNENTFTIFAENVPINGWSGWNIINTSGITTYGNTTSQYSKIRFTFGITAVSPYAGDPAHPTYHSAISISKILGFGGVGWGVPTQLAANGHLYSYDVNQNATFPAKVTATELSAPKVETGTTAQSYFQTRRLRGEGTADVYYHGIDFGYSGHNQVDFYEYGGIYNFHKHTGSNVSTGDTLLGTINDKGWDGKVNNHTINADVPADAKFTDTTYTGTSPISINSSNQVSIATASTSAYGATKLSTATNSTAVDLAATPSAVKTAYDLANTANGTANSALSGVNGNLIYDHTFSISNGIATFTPHVYQKGVEVTTNYNKSCFTWKYRKIDGTEVGLTTKNDRGCDVTITSMGYGGHVIGIFTPA